MIAVVLSLLSPALADDAPAEAPPAPEAIVADGPARPDRSAPPLVVPPEPLALPTPETHTLASGATVLLVPVPGVRKVEVSVLHGRGALDLAGWPTAVTSATGWLQDGATAELDPVALAEHSTLNEIEVTSWIALRNAGVELTVPKESLGAGVDLLGDVVREPAFPGKELRRYRRETLRWYEVEAATEPRTVASSALAHGWYPADHAFGARPDLDGFRKLRRGAIADTHARLIADAPTTVLVVGDVTWAEVEPLLNQALTGVGRPGEREPDPAFAPPAGTRVLAVDIPGAEQATLRLRTAAPISGDPDRVAMSMLDFAVGGSFLSRLNRNLREEKGFTYGVGSRYSTDETRGSWTVFVDVKAVNVRDAIAEIDRELSLVLADGVTADEIAAGRNSTVSSWNETLQTAASASGFYQGLVLDDETVDEARARIEALDGVTPDDVKRVANAWWGPDQPRLWVVVGDRASIEPQLRELGFEPEWITPEQAVHGVW